MRDFSEECGLNLSINRIVDVVLERQCQDRLLVKARRMARTTCAEANAKQLTVRPATLDDLTLHASGNLTVRVFLNRGQYLAK